MIRTGQRLRRAPVLTAGRARYHAMRFLLATWVIRLAFGCIALVAGVVLSQSIGSDEWPFGVLLVGAWVLTLWLVVLMPAVRSKARNPLADDVYWWRSPRLSEAERREVVTGNPGAGLHSGRFLPEDAVLGQRGEQLTAHLLTALTSRFPDARVFHGMYWPAQRSEADVDHAILVGDRLAVIDSKCWSAEAVTYADGRLWADGEDRDLVLPAALRQFQASFPFLRVEAWVAVHGSARTPRVTTSSFDMPIHLVAGPDLADDLATYLSAARRPSRVRAGSVRRLRALVKRGVA